MNLELNELRQIKTILLLLCCTGFIASMVFGQGKGVIKGTVKDAKTGEGLPVVNVKIKGTYYGAVTDFDGHYTIPKINPGSYTLEFSLVGYTLVQHTDVKVEADKESIVDLNMQETVLSLGQEVLVVGEKPLVNLEETASKHSISSDDLKATAIVDVRDVVSQQLGVVQTDNEIHIRGGRSSENAYLLDGVSIQDPLAGTGFGLQISTEAIENVQVITGGFNAEYGQATSGVVDVSLKEGSPDYHGSLSYKRDHLGRANGSLHIFNQDLNEFTLSGPEPLTTFLLPLSGVHDIGAVTFFTDFSANFSDGTFGKRANQINSSIFYGTRFTPREENNYFGLVKLTWKISQMMRISYSYTRSVSITQNSQALQTNLEYVESSPGFQYAFENILDNANTYTHDNQMHMISLTHTLSNSMFYELKYSHYFTHLRADANGLNYTQYTEPLDIVTFPVSYYPVNWPVRDTVNVIPGDGLYDLGNGFTWHDHYVIENSLKFDLTKNFSERNTFKTGFDITFQEMQNIDIYEPWVGTLGLNNDIYRVSPAFGALYAQDNITYGGMILNVGLRFDYWAPGQYVDDAVKDTNVITIPDEIRKDYMNSTYSFFGHRWKGRISPRIGISHPISDNQMLWFNYGQFSKRPKPQFVYAKLSPSAAQSSFQEFGNPDLNPETTVSYELGLRTQFSNNDVLTVDAYYKDIFDYVTTKSAKVTSARLSGSSFYTYINQDYATSRGIEAEYRKNIGKWFQGTITGSYSITTGKSSTPDEAVLVARGVDYETIKENYMSWDRPFQFNIMTMFNVVKDEPLFGFGRGVLDDYSFYIHAFYESGKRYTPYIYSGIAANGQPIYYQDINNLLGAVGQDWFWIDVNFEKSFKLVGIGFVFSVKVTNILDTKNSAIINPVTGKAYEYGDDTPYGKGWNNPLYPQLQSPVTAYPYDPSRYLAGRNVLFGLSMKF